MFNGYHCLNRIFSLCAAVLFLNACIHRPAEETIKAVTAQSASGKSASEAAEQVISGIRTSLSKPNLIIACSSFKDKGSEFAQSASKTAGKGVTVVTANTYLGMFTDKGFLGKENSAAGIGFTNLDFALSAKENALNNFPKAAEEISRELKSDNNKLLLVLANPELTHERQPFQTFLQNLASKMGNIPIIGGNFAETPVMAKIYLNGKELKKGIVCIALRGNISTGVATGSAYQVAGGPFKVTKTADYRGIAELDNKPIQEVYSKAAGIPQEDFLKHGIDNPLGIRVAGKIQPRYPWPNAKNNVLYRLPDELKKGDRVYVMEYKKDLLVNSAEETVYAAIRNMSRDTARTECIALIAPICIGRTGAKLQKEELAAMKKALPEGTPVFGFYAAGEFASPGQDSPMMKAYYCQLSVTCGALGVTE